MGFMKKNQTLFAFFVFMICMPLLYNVAFFQRWNNTEQNQASFTEKFFTINTSFSSKVAKNSNNNEWLLYYELKANTERASKNVSLQVQSIFDEDFFPIINLNEAKTVAVSFPTQKAANIVNNNLNDFYWLKVEGVESQNIGFNEEADITNLVPINYKTPQLSLNESISFDEHLYNLSWNSNLNQNYAWILLPTINLYSLDDLKTPLYRFDFNQLTKISYQFPDYVFNIANWCWIDESTLAYYFLDDNKSFQQTFVETNSISISEVPPQFSSPKINLNTAFYQKSQEINFIVHKQAIIGFWFA